MNPKRRLTCLRLHSPLPSPPSPPPSHNVGAFFRYVCIALQTPHLCDCISVLCDCLISSCCCTLADSSAAVAAHFGDQKDGVPVSCAKHREEQFVDVKNKLCKAAGCDRHAYFADGAEREGEKQSARKKAVRCARHKLATDVDIRNKKCKGMPGCGKQPIFGNPGGGAMHCASHRLEGEVDVRNPRCTVPDCTRRATKHRPGNEALGKICAKHCESMMRLLNTPALAPVATVKG